MTMVPQLRSQAPRLERVVSAVLVVLSASCLAASLPAAEPPVHFEHSAGMPPGAIGSAQLLRGGPLPGYFQPVAIRAPRGARIATAETGQFVNTKPGPLVAGMLIGQVYRLRVSGIPQQEGQEVYPTVEVIDRIFPPVGREFTFPIPIELTQEELEMALAGRFVMRVIYLEEPDDALPVVERPNQQSYFEAADGENPLDVADSLGRPMAILRMGGRVPDAEGPDANFLYGSPPLIRWTPVATATTERFDLDPLAQGPRALGKQAGVKTSGRVPIWRGPATR